METSGAWLGLCSELYQYDKLYCFLDYDNTAPFQLENKVLNVTPLKGTTGKFNSNPIQHGPRPNQQHLIPASAMRAALRGGKARKEKCPSEKCTLPCDDKKHTKQIEDNTQDKTK